MRYHYAEETDLEHIEGRGALNFGKSKARFMMEAETGVMFDDVAGVAEAKQELQEVVNLQLWLH